MELIEFEKHVMKMWNPDLNERETYINCILGITGEFLEVLDADSALMKENSEENRKHFLDEAGDFLFYVARWQIATGKIVVIDEANYIFNLEDYYYPISVLLGEIKKYAFHNKEFNVENFNKHIQTLFIRFNGLLQSCGFDLEQVMLYNVEKLSKRHGDSFKSFGEQNSS